jgi:hypothetical protein
MGDEEKKSLLQQIKSMSIFQQVAARIVPVFPAKPLMKGMVNPVDKERADPSEVARNAKQRLGL